MSKTSTSTFICLDCGALLGDDSSMGFEHWSTTRHTKYKLSVLVEQVIDLTEASAIFGFDLNKLSSIRTSEVEK